MSYTVYKKIKCFSKVFAGLLKANLNKKHIPFMLELQITRACNLSCDYCYADLENLYNKDYSLQDLKDIVDEFIEDLSYAVKKAKAFNFNIFSKKFLLNAREEISAS